MSAPNLTPDRELLKQKSTEELWALYNVIDRMYPTVDMSSTLNYYSVKCTNLKISIWNELKSRVEELFPL